MIDDPAGIGVVVWVEALTFEAANERARGIGIYFNGIDSGQDCPCCGDRWSEPWDGDEMKAVPEIDEKYDFGWHDTVYVHHADARIERILDPAFAGKSGTESEDL